MRDSLESMEAGGDRDAETRIRPTQTVVGVLLHTPFHLPNMMPHQADETNASAFETHTSMLSSPQLCGGNGLVQPLSTVWKSEGESEGSLNEDSRSWSSCRSNRVMDGSIARQGRDDTSSASAYDVNQENPLRSTSPSARIDAPNVESVGKLQIPYRSLSTGPVTLSAVWTVCVLLQVVTVALSAALSVLWGVFLTVWLLLGMFLFYTKVADFSDSLTELSIHLLLLLFLAIPSGLIRSDPVR